MSDLEKIKQLRQSTGAGFKDCGLALKESNGDLDKAAEILRVKGISKASKKMSRDAKEGVIVVSGNDKKTSIIEINCETDFVAKNDNFITFVKELSDLNNACSSDLSKLKNLKMKNDKTVYACSGCCRDCNECLAWMRCSGRLCGNGSRR